MARLGQVTFQSVVTASKWSTALESLVQAASKRRGTFTDSNGTTVPVITNRDAVQMIRAWHIAAGQVFSLWYQYAALAYGWDPPDSDMLDASQALGDQGYRLPVALWSELARVAMVLDGDNTPNPSLDLAVNYADPIWVAEIRAALLQDGASATFKIPTGMCIDKKTGKKRLPRLPFPGAKCENGKYKDPLTGRELACDMPGDCDPETIDDPITAVAKKLWPLVLIVGALWLITKDDNPPRRRRRN